MKNNISKIILLSLATILTACGTTSNSSSDVANNSSNGNNSNTNTSNTESNGHISNPGDKTWTINSLDSSLKVNIYLKSGYVTYEVLKNNKYMVHESSLLLSTDTTSFDCEVEFYDETQVITNSLYYTSKSGSYSTVNKSYNNIVLSFKDINDMIWDLEFKVFNDGYAFQHSISALDGSEGELTFYTEESTWKLPNGTLSFPMEYTPTDAHPWFSYEEYYNRTSLSKLVDSNCSMPFLYKTTDGYYSLITESELIGSNFYGSFLTSYGDNTIQTIPAFGAEKEGEDGISMSYPLSLPWRVCATGTLGDILENNLVEEVYGNVEYWKPDNYNSLTNEEKEIYNYDWVEPGVVAWNWLSYTGNRPQNDWDLQKEYVDLAYEMGWKYTILDGGWDASLSNLDNLSGFLNFMEYAKSKNIKVIAWGNGLTKTTPAAMEMTLNQWVGWGISGVKLDFFDGQNGTLPSGDCGESQVTVDHYEKIYQECAKRKMVVNCHGGNKPTGERRIYPHVLNREGIRGNEMRSMDSNQLCMIPFIRGCIGPSDYTPVLNPLTKGVTMGMQLAQCVIYESGLPSMAGKANEYYDSIAKEVLKKLPAAWDDLKFLDGDITGITSHCVLARRKGNEWWIAGIGVDAKEFTLDLSFLDANTSYNADMYLNGSAYNTIRNEKQTVNSTTQLKVSITDNGGFLIRLTK